MASLSRQARRKQKREQLKKQQKLAKARAKNPDVVNQLKQQTQQASQQASQQLQLLIKEVDGLTRSIKLIDNHLWMIVETLSDKGIMEWSDVNQMEQNYMDRERKRRAKIKELLASDMPLDALMEEIEEDPNEKRYKKLDLNPIKELNQNPYEVGSYLYEKHPGLTNEEYLALGKKWELTLEHFGIAEEKEEEEKKEEGLPGAPGLKGQGGHELGPQGPAPTEEPSQETTTETSEEAKDEAPLVEDNTEETTESSL